MKNIRLFLSLFFLITLALCGNAGNAVADQGYIYRINPVYDHVPADRLFPRLKSPERSAGLSTCNSYEELKATMYEQFALRETSFRVLLQYAFNFSDVEDIISQALDEIMADDHYLAFSYTSYGAGWSGFSGNVLIDFDMTYFTTYEQEQQVTQEVEDILFGTEAIISDDMDEEEKEMAIHDWIVSNVAYDTTYSEYSAYAALFLGTTVCQGYSLLAYKMLEEVGIDTIIVGSDTLNHAWNMVNVCGNWYHLDVTWDDPVPDVPGRVLYTYFNLSDSEMSVDHEWEQDQYPEAPTSEVSCDDYQEAISLLEPEEGEVLSRRPPPTFSWEADSDYRFKIQFSSNSSFEESRETLIAPRRGFINEDSTDGLRDREWIRTWNMIRSIEEENGIVYWRVTGSQGPTSPEETSNVRSFTIE